jgi:Flp pilus assembly protein TadD
MPGESPRIVDEAPVRLTPEKPAKATPKMLVDFGYVHMAAGKLSEACQHFERAIDVDPKHTPAYVALAKAKVAMGHPDQAIVLLTQALETQPKDAALWNELGIAYTKLEKYPEATSALEKATQFDRKSELYLSNLAGVQVVTGNVDRAYALYSQFLSAADARVRIASIMQGQGRLDEERNQLEMAIEADPTHQTAHMMLQRLHTPPPIQAAGYQSGPAQR